ncbi:hypothetical protein [Pedobacter sp. UYP1]|uniref:hypothetical protein n=1 Tax=Pedobacter sp. UYP1 TaxID=1756396 RepID=UPI0033951EEC
MKKIYIINLFIIGLFITFCGCRKQENLNILKSEKKNTNAIIPDYFEWEVGDYMPSQSGINILRPWASGANQSFPLIYTTDIKKADGWELVYNTFSTTKSEPSLYFVLYNKYRGLLRGYFYLTPGTPIPSSYIVHSLIPRTGTLPITLTYNANGPYDLGYMNNPPETVNNGVSLTQQFKTTSTGTWYAAEFEMAYDSHVSEKEAASNLITWQINSINASDLAINGTSQGGINGTIAQPNAPGPGIFGSLIQGALDFAGFKALGSLIKQATSEGTKKIFESLQDAAKAGLTGQAKNVVNGIFGGSSGGADSTKQYIHLTTNTTYKLTGTQTDIYSLATPSMVIPGSKNQDIIAAGYSPLYKKALGIVNLSKSPTAYSWSEGNFYTIDHLALIHDYNVMWNPDIINSSPNGATIKNLKQDILIYEDAPYYAPNDGPMEFDGQKTYFKRNIDNLLKTPNSIIELPIEFYDTCSGCDFSSLLWLNRVYAGQKLPNHLLRLTFDVVPNNGAPKSTIVKSFNIYVANTPAL